MAPETSMEIQAALHSDIALVFDECTPFNVTRDYTARSTERTHRWLDRCLAWHAEHGPRRPARLRDRPGRGGGGPAARLRAGGRRARPRRDRDRRHAGRGQAADVRGRRVGGLRAAGARGPATCSGSARSTTCCAASSSGSTPSTARCRPASAATAWRSCPTRPCAGGSTSPRAATARPTSRSSRAARARPARAATPAPTSTTCSRRRESTARALLTIHNLAYLQMLMAALRDAIAAGRLAEAAAAARAGAAPWERDVNCALRRGCELPRRLAMLLVDPAGTVWMTSYPTAAVDVRRADRGRSDATTRVVVDQLLISSTASCTLPRMFSRSWTAWFESSCTPGRRSRRPRRPRAA